MQGPTRYRVVIADDYEDIRLCLAEILADEFEVVASVGDGMQLISAVTQFAPDVLIVDVVMPVLNGLEALRALTEAGIAFTAVMVSANTERAYIERALALGAIGYVSKTTAACDLLQAVRAALRGERFISAAQSEEEGNGFHRL